MNRDAPFIFIIDNYDSFTYNLSQAFQTLGARVEVARNDAFGIPELIACSPDAVVISPGPGTPDHAGRSCEAIEHLAGRVPVLGVCLGHQCIGQVFGGRVVRAPELVHGKTSVIEHDGERLFQNLQQPFEATRYHSLVIDRVTLPAVLSVTARTSDGLVMGVRHKYLPWVEGVQFHPESFLTIPGPQLLHNFLRAVDFSARLPVAVG